MDHHLQTTILGQQRARKNAQDEALLLYNRVRQLQKEEEKAQKRIVETKKKAKEIIKLRERNELKLQEKYERAKEQAELLEQQKIENLKSKEEQLRNRIDQENKILTEKLSVVQQTKEERAEIERLLAESRLLSRKEALEQKEVIRKQQEDARRKIETLKLSKLKEVSMQQGGIVARGVIVASRPIRHVACNSHWHFVFFLCWLTFMHGLYRDYSPLMVGRTCNEWRVLYCICLHVQAQDDYERRLNEEIDAKRAKELEIERLVSAWLHQAPCMPCEHTMTMHRPPWWPARAATYIVAMSILP